MAYASLLGPYSVLLSCPHRGLQVRDHVCHWHLARFVSAPAGLRTSVGFMLNRRYQPRTVADTGSARRLAFVAIQTMIGLYFSAPSRVPEIVRWFGTTQPHPRLPGRTGHMSLLSVGGVTGNYIENPRAFPNNRVPAGQLHHDVRVHPTEHYNFRVWRS